MGRLAGHRIDPFLLAGGKAEEIGHGFRGFVVEQVDFDVTFGGAHDDGSHGPKCLMGLRPAAAGYVDAFVAELDGHLEYYCEGWLRNPKVG